ncbi:MAG: LodA/GoxA family CTQ-dependent oxidase [Gemmataceae bacterium]
MEYRIFPAIGIARIGNSPDMFVGPEVIGSHGRDIATGGETEMQDFKDTAFQVKKQAARFHLYQRAPGTTAFVPVALPPGASVRWTVRVANKKDAIQRPSAPPPTIPTGGLRPTLDPARANRLIDPGNVSISGASAAGVFLDGTHVGNPVRLGELRTDAFGRLLVLGGPGISRSTPPSPIGGSFYDNPNWHDDVADGVVSAEFVDANGQVTMATSAWVIIGPPDFAPGAESVVSLYDEVQQLAVDHSWWPKPTTTSFTQDVYPILRRARSLRWSHGRKNLAGTVVSEQTWNNISDDYPHLANAAASEMTFRAQQQALVLKIETLLVDYSLTAIQKDHLQRWAAGTFASDWTGTPPIPASPSPASLTESALRGTAGQGFYPGIEGGRILMDPSIYMMPFDFRIDPTVLTPGDVTALMAQPWQADFLKCSGSWWPSQRPDIAPQPGNAFKLWARIGPAGAPPNHQQLVDHVMQFGFVTPRFVGGTEVCLEEGRDTAAVGN